jgi:hypothetical protein
MQNKGSRNCLNDVHLNWMGPADDTYKVNRKAVCSGDLQTIPLTILRNGHYQVHGLSNGTAFIVFEVYDANGKLRTKVVKQYGNSIRVIDTD